MTTQELIAYALGLSAVGYLAWRLVRRRLAGTCCGERECPAAKRIAQRIAQE